ncbi:MAG: hypothetical protein M3Y72_07710 [Acidobacteriota bacterium]|nr:hypothetical protein [Acidobacteriota bacterium]
MAAEARKVGLVGGCNFRAAEYVIMLNMKFRVGLLAVSFALALQAQMQMNVQQLADFVRSELALRQHTDKQLAAYVKKVQLTERLPDKTVKDLVAQGAQPKTEEALRALEAETASIKHTAAPDTTYSPATAPDNTLTAGPATTKLGVEAPPPPPPDSVHQQQILDAMRQYALTYTQSLPNYLCVRVDRRYVDPRGGDHYMSLGALMARVSYVDGQEQSKVYSNGGKIVDPDLGGIGGGGARSTGEFAGMMRSLFEPRSDAEFGWDHWAKLRGRVMAVFSYFIDSGHSSYSISYSEGPGDEQRIITAYRGLVYADANTGEIDRITFNAVDVPSSFPVRTANERIDYDLVTIGTQQSVLPLSALLHMSTVHETSKNEIEFRNYRKFGTESIIKYDMEQSSAGTPAPLPSSKTDEQPVNGGAKPADSTANGSASQQPAKAASNAPAASPSSPWTLPAPPPPPPPQ